MSTPSIANAPSGTPALVPAPATPELALRSLDATWDRARWESLAADGNRYEVIDGVLYMSTAPSFFHQWIVRCLFVALHAQIDTPGIGITLWSPISVFMPGCDPVQPDLLVIRNEDLGIIHDRHINGVPALLIEVLSPGNAQVDLETKRKTYARAGLAEYWVIRPVRRDALIHTLPDGDLGDFARSTPVPPGGELVSATLPIRFPVASLFAGAPDTTL